MCANSCGFFGSAATKTLCSKCYKEHLIKTAALVEEKKIAATATDANSAAAAHEPDQPAGHQDPDSGATAAAATVAVAAATPVARAPTTGKKSGAAFPLELLETLQKQEASGSGCGYFGYAHTKNMCTLCYRDFLKNEQPAAQISAATASSSGAAAPAPAAVAVMKAAPNRCASCRKKVGLLGFPCRCGATFCSLHRHAEKHACTFDFKTAGREKIAKNNPLVVAAKINKI